MLSLLKLLLSIGVCDSQSWPKKRSPYTADAVAGVAVGSGACAAALFECSGAVAGTWAVTVLGSDEVGIETCRKPPRVTGEPDRSHCDL